MGGGGALPGIGLGPGGGDIPTGQSVGGNASHGTNGVVLPPFTGLFYGRLNFAGQAPTGETYGNDYCLPLQGGSGGSGIGGPVDTGGQSPPGQGGGGGGAILIAVSGSVEINGGVSCNGGNGSPEDQYYPKPWAGSGSGGALRIIATNITGTGTLDTTGGGTQCAWTDDYYGRSATSRAGSGRVRLDALSNAFSGSALGLVSRGYQPIIIPPQVQAVVLAIQSVGGVVVSPTPTGKPSTPDVILPAAQQTPVSIVIGCTNIPLGTEIIVDVKPANGPAIRAVGLNNTGTQANSTAIVQVQMPRGGGTIQAKAISGIQLAANDDPNAEHLSLAQTGWTADGESFKSVEVTAGLGNFSQLAYLTESGKRYTLGNR